VDQSRLAYMANQIARNFAALGEEEAVAATADHIVKYWDPRMKAAVLADRAGLEAIAAAAVARLAS
jgi:formate dehydrogenase subunit delta